MRRSRVFLVVCEGHSGVSLRENLATKLEGILEQCFRRKGNRKLDKWRLWENDCLYQR